MCLQTLGGERNVITPSLVIRDTKMACQTSDVPITCLIIRIAPFNYPARIAAGTEGSPAACPRGWSAYLLPAAVWQQGHQAEAALSPSPRLRTNAVPPNPGPGSTASPDTRGGGREEGEKIRGQGGYDIHGGGPQSCVIHITHTTSFAICQQGRNAAGVKQSREANGAWLSRCCDCSSRTSSHPVLGRRRLATSPTALLWVNVYLTSTEPCLLET